MKMLDLFRVFGCTTNLIRKNSTQKENCIEILYFFKKTTKNATATQKGDIDEGKRATSTV